MPIMRRAYEHCLRELRRLLAWSANSRLLRAISVAALVGVVCVALLFAALDWNALRGFVAREFAERTGRELVIAGDLDVQLRWHPRIVAHEVSISNPAWARRADLVTARRITLVLSIPALLRGDFALQAVELIGPRLALEQRDGLRTWASGRDGGGRAPTIGRLRIEDGVVEFLDPAMKTAITAEVTAAGRGADDDVSVSAQGTYRGERFRAQAHGPSVLGLAERSTPYRLEAALQAGKTRALVAGTVTGLPSPTALDVMLELSGDDLASLQRFVGVATASTPPYTLRGRMRRGGDRWSFEEMRGRIGDSDVAGMLAYTASSRPHLQLDVVAEKLDFDDLGPLIGAPPKTTLGESASPAQRLQAQRMKRADQALPTKPFDFGRWERLDVDASLAAKRVLRPPALPIDGLEARLRIRDGVLRLEPLRMRTAGGEIVATIELDGRKRPLRGMAEMEMHGLALARLFPAMEAMKNARGVAHGRARLEGNGASVAELLGSADGRISLAIDRGWISNLVLERMGLDAGESLLLFATGDREIALRCAVADFGVRRGVATSNVLVLDTDDTLVVGGGVVDLAGERLNLTLYPRPKDASVLSARSPLHVRGSLRNPQVTPDATALATRGLAAALLALVNPLLALAPLIETGPGKDSDCAQLLQRAQTWSEAKGAARPGASDGRR
jgi:uncharacterized protein involved in outer membrane biogenesis